MIAAITTYFNYCKYKRLLANYWRFRENLKGVDLFTIELSYDGQYDIPDAYHVRGNLENVMWQKERLLNLLERKLDAKYDKVAWIDADLLFFNPHWVEDAEKTLERYYVVQLCHRMFFLDAKGEVFKDWYSYGSRQGKGYRFPGLAWAARREVFPLMDDHILGGGDTLQLRAWEGKFGGLKGQMHDRWLRHFYQTGLRHFRKVRGNVGYIPGDLAHLYHGTTKNRNYVGRWAFLRDGDFDPKEDIAIDENGIWKWTTPKLQMHRQVRDYFTQRREDD